MNGALRILTITSEWIDTGHGAPFIARQVEFLRRAGIDVEVFAFRGQEPDQLPEGLAPITA